LLFVFPKLLVNYDQKVFSVMVSWYNVVRTHASKGSPTFLQMPSNPDTVFGTLGCSSMCSL
jgi:hypothetical protein